LVFLSSQRGLFLSGSSHILLSFSGPLFFTCIWIYVEEEPC
jgi:hypothetical protein